MIEVNNRSRLSGQALDIVRTVIGGFSHVEHVARFAETQVPPFAFAGSAAYDDHTHDLVVSRPSDSMVFVFDATCSGELRRVTIFDRFPSPSDLLIEREAAALPAATNGAGCRFGGHPLPVEAGLAARG